MIVETVLSVSCQSDTGMIVLLQVVENNNLNAPLNEVYLKSNLITGPVVVGVIPSLPIRKVDLILGNNLARKIGCRPTCFQHTVLSSVEFIKSK